MTANGATHVHRLLLVDDYVPVRIILRNILTGYVDLRIVGEACDGKQAIEQVAACQPDIILMDYNMPMMNGIEAAASSRNPGERQSSLDYVRFRIPISPMVFSRQAP